MVPSRRARRNVAGASFFLPGVSWGTMLVDLKNRRQEKPEKNKNSSSRRRRNSSTDEQQAHEAPSLAEALWLLTAAEGQSLFLRREDAG